MNDKLKDLLRSEFIGLNVEIIESRNKDLVGIKGKVIDETRSAFKIMTSKGMKIVLKEQITLMVEKNENKFRIDGKLLINRPEDRVRKLKW